MHQSLATALFVLVSLATLEPARAESVGFDADILIVGGTESGCAAAVQAARMGVKKIVLVNDIDWLGGQFSAEALIAIDENRGPAGYDHTVPFPRAGFFKEVIDGIEALNKEKYGRARPGNTRVITTCRPSDAEQVFRQLLQPYVDSGQLRIISDCYPIGAILDASRTRLLGLEFASDTDAELNLTVKAKLTIDASDWGDAIKAAGAAYEFGPDLKSKYGEPLAPKSRDGYPLTDMNPITYCMVINETDDYEPVPAPPRYDARNYRTHKWPKDPLWLYESRRVIDHYNFGDVTHPDVLLLCFPAIDYPLDVHPKWLADALEATARGASTKNIVELNRFQRQLIFEDAKQYSLGFLHYLQTEVHEAMPDKTHSYRRFELTDEFGTKDGLPFKPYIRESLRLKAMYMMRQQDTTGFGGNARNFAQAMYHDGIACWQFEYDFHPTKREFLDNGNPDGPWRCAFRAGRTWGPPYSGPAVFPLRSLVPEKVDGLIAAQKNLGYSSIVSSAIRLHDQSTAIGTAAGAVAAVAVSADTDPRAIPYDRSLLSRVWNGLCNSKADGVPHTLWPFHDLKPDHPAFVAANQLAIRGGLPLSPRDTAFHPDEPATIEWLETVAAVAMPTKQANVLPIFSDKPITRGKAVIEFWKLIRDFPDAPFKRQSPTDADGDGTLDADDALLFSADKTSWSDFVLPPEIDGNPDWKQFDNDRVKLFNFTGKGSPAVDGITSDDGQKFDADRGFGWKRDISASHRRRGQVEGILRDTFLFTRSHDVWEHTVPNGSYQVIVCIGDSGHEQIGQNVAVEGISIFKDHDTPAGEWAEGSASINVADGRITVEIGRPEGSTNTCINWLEIVKR